MRASNYPVQLLGPCPSCQGDGCMRCDGHGEVPAVCETCGAPAFHALGALPTPAADGGISAPTHRTLLCPPCYFVCTRCEEPTSPDDRLRFGEGFLHAACAMTWQAQHPERGPFLELAESADNTVRTNERSCARASGGGNVPKASDKLTELMAADGFISLTRASELSGHGLTTLRNWMAERPPRLRFRRSGWLVFVELESLKECCPQVGAPRRAAVNS